MNWITSIVIILIVSVLPALLFTNNDGYGTGRVGWVIGSLIIGIIAGLIPILAGWTTPLVIATAVFMFFAMTTSIGFFDGDEGTLKLCGGLMIIILLSIYAGVFVALPCDMNNAADFNTMVTVTTDDPFENEIPDEMVRLVTEEYAEYIVVKNAWGEFGSNRRIAATSIVLRGDQLVWVSIIVSTRVETENLVYGMVIVDACNGSVTDIIHAEDINFDLAEGLWWTENIQAMNYWGDMNNIYNDAYPVWDDNDELVYVQTRTNVDMNFVERPLGPIVYYQGERPVYYDSIDDVPEWLPRAYSEDWLERQVNRWGSARRDTGFDIFAGGLPFIISPSNNRLEMSEDVRYILNPDTMTMEGLVVAHPISGELTCSGVFRATQTEIIYHDFSERNFLAGQGAIDNIVGELDKPSQGYYDGAMPLLYPVTVNNETKWTWYAPIYFYRTFSDDDGDTVTNIELHALAMVDATDSRKYYTQEVAGEYDVGAELVHATKVGYKALFGDIEDDTPITYGNQTVLSANVTGKWTYNHDGETHIVLQTNDTELEFIEGRPDMMNVTDWYSILSIDIGETFQALVQIGSDGRYWILSFLKI